MYLFERNAHTWTVREARGGTEDFIVPPMQSDSVFVSCRSSLIQFFVGIWTINCLFDALSFGIVSCEIVWRFKVQRKSARG